MSTRNHYEIMPNGFTLEVTAEQYGYRTIATATLRNFKGYIARQVQRTYLYINIDSAIIEASAEVCADD